MSKCKVQLSTKAGNIGDRISLSPLTGCEGVLTDEDEGHKGQVVLVIKDKACMPAELPDEDVYPDTDCDDELLDRARRAGYPVA